MDRSTRRRFLQLGGLGSVFSLTGCLRLSRSSEDDSEGATATVESTPESGGATATTDATPESGDGTSTTESTTETGDATTESTSESDEAASTTEESSPQYTIVEGSVSSEAGVSLEGHQVEIYNQSNREFHKLSIDDGNFAETVEPDSSINLTFFYEGDDGGTDVDGVPLLYSLAEGVSVSGENEEVGPFTLPQAYRTDIRIVDPDGNPVEDFPIRFRCPNGSGTGVRSFTTDSDGYAKSVGASQTGFYFADEITVEGGKEDGGSRLRDITVTEQSEYTIEVLPDRYDL